jgi:hypothetical protein
LLVSLSLTWKALCNLTFIAFSWTLILSQNRKPKLWAISSWHWANVIFSFLCWSFFVVVIVLDRVWIVFSIWELEIQFYPSSSLIKSWLCAVFHLFHTIRVYFLLGGVFKRHLFLLKIFLFLASSSQSSRNEHILFPIKIINKIKAKSVFKS